MNRKTQRQHTAIHEAGHAVIARRLGIGAGAVSIVADGDSSGHSICPDPWEIVGAWDAAGKWWRGEDTALLARVLTFMAGAEAETEILGSCAGGDGEDRYQVAMMLEALGERWATEPKEERLRRVCRHLVRRHRTAIEGIAALLLKRGRLSDNQVQKGLATLQGESFGPSS